jgi:hypothetical protein
MGNVAESYYSARSRRDPAWRRRVIAEQAERERARRERDPETFRARRRVATARSRAKQVAYGLTFTELLQRSPIPDPVMLRLVLNDELRRGRIDYCGSSRRYILNGALDDDTKIALRDLKL